MSIGYSRARPTKMSIVIVTVKGGQKQADRTEAAEEPGGLC